MKFKILVVALFLCTNLLASGFLPIANVTKVKGHATINKEQIKTGSEIVSGVEISIPKKKDFVEVKFQNGHIVRFTGSEVVVGEFTPKATYFDLLKGKILTNIKALTPDETYTVKTPHATFKMHNGKNILVVSKQTSHLEVLEGTVSVKNSLGDKEVQKGQKFDFKN